MSPHMRSVFSNAMDLSPVERAELIEKLLSSFEFRSRKSIDARWAKEVEKRLDAFDRGNVKAIPAREVFRRIDKRRR